MKKALLVLIAIAIIIFIFGFAQTCFAQDKKWASKEEAGEFFELNKNNISENIYEPRDLKGFREIGVGEEIVTFPYYATVKMAIISGTFWVIQKPETEFVAKNGKVIRLKKCGNKISGFFKLPLSSSPLSITTPVTESLIFKSEKEEKGDRGDKGDKGDPGKDGESIESSSSWPLVIVAAIITAGAVAIAFILRNNEKKDEKASTITPPGIDTGGAN